MDKSDSVKSGQWIFILSNVYDDQYHHVRGEEVQRCLSSGKRKNLFRSIELATDSKLVLLSSPPKAIERTQGKWLPEVETLFSSHRQLFCANWDVAKLRIPFSWFFYAKHVCRHVKNGDLIILDNYELIYVIAALWTKAFRRNITVLLDYEDGKHLIDKGGYRLLSRLAEFLGKPLVRGALLAHPSLAERLPAIPTELVPGFLNMTSDSTAAAIYQKGPVRFLYSGSLDEARGIDILCDAVCLLPSSGWELDITGNGPLEQKVRELVDELAEQGHVVRYHRVLSQTAYDELVSHCHVGLNCQRTGDPISDVTFPSKVFSYLSSGLVVLSTKASQVPEICGDALLYVERDTPKHLGMAMKAIIEKPHEELGKAQPETARTYFSLDQTALRLREFFKKVRG